MLKFAILLSVLGTNAFAANVLTIDQLQLAAHESLKDYSNREPEMAPSTTGYRVSTVGNNAQVIIEMKADGMNMSAKYLCAPQGANMACRQQQ